MPKVSIIITAHNYAHYLPKCIQSALDQNHNDFEVIVVNDGSTDNTAEILERYKDSVRIVTLSGLGLARACNEGIRASSGEYIIRLDADDYFDENILLLESNILDTKPDIHMVYPDYYTVDGHGQIIEHIRLPRANDEVKLLDRSALAAGAMYRRECYEAINGYSEELKRQEDYDFWIRFIEKFNVYNVNLPLMYYRKHTSSMSSANLEMRMQARRYVKQKYVTERGFREKRNILCVIPATSLFRNTMKLAMSPLGEQPVIAHTITEAQKTALIDKIIVTTEDAEIAALSESLGVSAPFLRPKELTAPGVPMEQVIDHTLDYLAQHEDYTPDIIVLLHIACPFRKEKHITEAIDTLLLYDVDSVLSVVTDLSFHWKQGEYGLKMTGYKKRLLREEKETIYKENGALYVFKTSNLSTGDMLGTKVSSIEMFAHESLRLESPFDFWVAKHLLKEQPQGIVK